MSTATDTNEIETDLLRDTLAQGTNLLPSRSCSAAFDDFDWSQLPWADGDLGPNSFTVNGVTYTVEISNPNNHSFTNDSPNLGDNNFNEPALFARPDMVGGGYIEFVVTIDRPITGVEGIVDDVDKRDFNDTWQDQVTITGFLGTTAVTPFLSAFDPNNVVVTGNVAIGQTADNFPTGGGHGADVAFGFGNQPIDRFVVRYEPGPDLPMHSAAQHVTLNNWSFCSDPTEDYGDAPTSGTAPVGSGTNNYGDASHTIVSGVYLGAGEPDAEISSQASADADGDDTDGGDDDDGVTIPALNQGQSATLDIDVAGAGGYLQGWIDWDGDGTFGAGEQIATDVQDDGTNGDTIAGDGVINLPVTVPVGAITLANTFGRFRWSTTQGLDATTAASDGEVEDYQVAIAVNYETSPSSGQIIINEVLYNGGGSSAADNNEFIELYNASGTAVDLSGWQLADGNLVLNDTDLGGSITGDASNPAYVFPASTTLAAGAYAVIWIGDNTPAHQASDAALQVWLSQAPKLNNGGDDIWLYDDQTRIVDYVAYGTNNAINPPPTALNIWDDTHQSDLDGASSNQSISLTPNGQDGDTSACWEPTTSGDASSRCPGFLPTRNTGVLTGGFTSVGASNNGPPVISLVKRITAINGSNAASNGDPMDAYIDDGTDPDDDGTNLWPTPVENYLIGGINVGTVLPDDELEYTIYFLSGGDTTARNTLMCDYIPTRTTFVSNAFNAGPAQDTGTLTGAGLPGADLGIVLSIGGTIVSLTNATDNDGGAYFPPGIDPANTFPNIDCEGDGDSENSNPNGAVVIDVGDLPNATAPGTPGNSYGFFQFRGRVK